MRWVSIPPKISVSVFMGPRRKARDQGAEEVSTAAAETVLGDHFGACRYYISTGLNDDLIRCDVTPAT
jgi:hypothetical protein